MNGSILVLLICCGCLISSATGASVASSAEATAQEIERLYNEVLKSSLDSWRLYLNQTKDTTFIDWEYFELLDMSTGREYPGAAYTVFTIIHSSNDGNDHSREVLQQLLPHEKILVRDFFTRAGVELQKYFKVTQQTKADLMQKLISWQSELGDSVIAAFIDFPKTLRTEVPELPLMDYETKLQELMVASLQTVIAGLRQAVKAVMLGKGI